MLRLTKNNLIKFRSFSTPSVVVPDTFTRFARFAAKNKTLFQDAIAKQNKDNPDLKVVALELKDEFGRFKWPSFEEVGQQDKERLPQIYFHRFDKYDELRHQQTIDRLQDSFTGWLGTPGIGKSTGVNYILYQMVANLGSPGFPSVVYYRLPDDTVIFSKQIKDQDIRVQTFGKIPLDDLIEFVVRNDLLFHGTKESKGKSCLILELKQTEIDPILDVPTLVTVSTKFADLTLQTLFKGGLRPYLVGPPTREQMLFMEWTKYLNGVDLWYLRDERFSDEEIKQQLLLPPNNENKQLFASVIEKILHVVGPIPRAFSDFDKYEDRAQALIDSETLSEAIDSVKQMKNFNIPSSVKYFLAPYPKFKSEIDPTDTPLDAPVCRRGLFVWLFLSPTAENLYINAKISLEQSKKLQETGMNYRVAESRVKQYLKKEFEDTWEWFEDVGYGRSLNTEQMVDPIILPEVKSYTLLEDAFINQPVDTLAANSLYHSRAHNFRVGDFVMVDHKKKVCYYFQVTLVDPKDHPVKLTVLENVMNRLKIVEKNYKLHLIFVIDRVNRLPFGSKFTFPEKVKEKEKVKQIPTTLRKLKNGKGCPEKWQVLAKHIETTIARASLSHEMGVGMPSQQTMTQSEPETPTNLKSKYESLTVVVLKAELKKHNLSVGGKKEILVERLVEYFKNNPSSEEKK